MAEKYVFIKYLKSDKTMCVQISSLWDMASRRMCLQSLKLGLGHALKNVVFSIYIFVAY